MFTIATDFFKLHDVCQIFALISYVLIYPSLLASK